jgi:Uri superfamily endonuclease
MPYQRAHLSPESGSYVLILAVPRKILLDVGKLGPMVFKRGWYAYVGSAFGPGGLAARLGRHLEPVQKRHWHIDYLRAEAVLVDIWAAAGLPKREHLWASILMSNPNAGQGVIGFGCSDCRCPSHLIYFAQRPARGWLRNKLGAGCVWPPPAGKSPADTFGKNVKVKKALGSEDVF